MAISESEAAGVFLLDQLMGYTYQAALRVAAVLGVADHLVKEPKTAEELAKATGANGQRLHRVLRLLATRNVFTELEDGRFQLTPAAEYLRTDVSHSLRSATLMLTDERLWRAAGELTESVRGNSAFKHIYGMSFWDYWAQDGVSTEDFHVGMSSMSEVENLFLARSYEFPNNAKVVDIAGGFGGLLLRVLQQNPTLHGVLFDRPHVLARNRLNELGDDSRWETAEGDFFKAVPSADVYLIKYIIHDWPDEKAMQILRCVRKAMTAGARVLIMDTVIPRGNVHHTGKVMDLVCMGIYDGGTERTEEEFHQLLAGADLKINRIINKGGYISTIEAVAK
jgi:hypothetical protein